MLDFVEIMRVAVPTVAIPAGVFAGNWAIRYKSEYAQTAASDFILAILIFDGAVVTTAKDFEPFIQNAELRQIIIHWHVILGMLSMALWWTIATFGEPPVAAYYSAKRNRPAWPFGTLVLCWVGVFILVAMHIGFFLWRGVSHV